MKSNPTTARVGIVNLHTCDNIHTHRPGEALENGDVSRVARNEEFLGLLRGLSSDKIDFATAHLLSHWDSISGGDEVRYRTLQGPSRLVLFIFVKKKW